MTVLFFFFIDETVDYRTTITFTATADNMPEGVTIIWYKDGQRAGPGEKLTYIENYSGNIDKGLLSTIVSASITGKSNVTSVKIKLELQKLSGGSYSTVETWEQSFSGRSGSMEESKLTNPLSTYRLKATFTAYGGSNSESKEIYAYWSIG